MIEIKNLSFAYSDGDFRLFIPELQIAQGESIAITGPSGSGKTTLLNLISGVLQAQGGTVRMGEQIISEMSENGRREHRISHMGMVFQNFELLEYLNVSDNILLPYRLEESLRLNEKVRQRAKEISSIFGMEQKLSAYPKELSQGQKQRVAICRSLVTGAKLIIADEPTGNLDPKNTALVADTLLDFVKRENASLITVTHDLDFAKRFDREIDFMKLLQAGTNV